MPTETIPLGLLDRWLASQDRTTEVLVEVRSAVVELRVAVEKNTASTALLAASVGQCAGLEATRAAEKAQRFAWVRTLITPATVAQVLAILAGFAGVGYLVGFPPAQPASTVHAAQAVPLDVPVLLVDPDPLPVDEEPDP